MEARKTETGSDAAHYKHLSSCVYDPVRLKIPKLLGSAERPARFSEGLQAVIVLTKVCNYASIMSLIPVY